MGEIIKYISYIAVLLVIIFVSIVICWYCQYFRYYRHLKKLPRWGLTPSFGVTSILRNPTEAYKEFSTLFHRLGDKVFSMLGPHPCLITNDPNLVKFAMTSKSVKKTVGYQAARIFLGGGIIISNDQEWKTQRKLLNPAFHYNILEKYITIFSAQSDRMMTVLEKEVKCDSTDTWKYLVEYGLSTAYETSIGTSYENIKDKMPSYIEDSIKNINVVYERLCNPLHYFDFFYKFSKNYRIERQVRRNIDELIDTVIRDHNSKRASGLLTENEEFEKRSKPPLLDLLLQYKENNCFYTDQLLKDEIHTVIIAATDTTSTALAYIIQVLADHPEAQEKAFREVESIYLQQSQPTISISELSKMNYLQAVIQETMRLYPPASYIPRTLAEDVEYDGMLLKKGLTLLMVNYEIHKNPKYHPEPNKFMPERFLSEKTSDVHMFSYIPFAIGSRSCIGNRYAMLSLKTFLYKLLLNYEIISVNHKLVLQPQIILLSKTGYKVRLRRRKCTAP